jgi:beta-lactamase regulating signal transducer with metallopeptidase domain
MVVSSGLQGSLSTEEYKVVLAHEQAHAAACDNLVISVAHAINAGLFFFPGVRRGYQSIRRSVEIAADAFASKQIGDRLLVASSLSRVATLVLESADARRARPQPTAAFFEHEELVVERVHHLIFDRGLCCSHRRLLCAAVTLVFVFGALGFSIFAVTGDNIAGSTQAAVCADSAGT